MKRNLKQSETGEKRVVRELTITLSPKQETAIAELRETEQYHGMSDFQILLSVLGAGIDTARG